MSTVSISIEENLSNEERQIVLNGLDSYNDGRTPEHHYRELNIMVRRDGEVVRGLLGHTHWTWLYVRILWVADDLRGQGFGSRLMQAAEKEAIQRGCLHAHCSTFGFQALRFYQKLGYTVFGTLDDYPEGSARYFLQKRNLEKT